MDPGNSRGPVATRADDTTTSPVDTVAPAADDMAPLRFPCRTRGCPNDRPAVPVGCAGMWDKCRRCAGRVLRGRPYAFADNRPSIDPWAERVAELLEMAEASA